MTEKDIGSYMEQFKADRETAIKEIQEIFDYIYEPYSIETVLSGYLY